MRILELLWRDWQWKKAGVGGGWGWEICSGLLDVWDRSVGGVHKNFYELGLSSMCMSWTCEHFGRDWLAWWAWGVLGLFFSCFF